MAPDTIGVAIEVPVFLTYVPSLVPRPMISCPEAKISGYTTPPPDGPISSMLPTVIIFLEIPGTVTENGAGP